MALTDREGRIAHFKLAPGNAAEVTELTALLNDVPLHETSELLGDKAYDSDALRDRLALLGIIPTIPSRSNRRNPAEYDHQSYKARHLVENAFADAKQFRGIATRYCKLAETFSGMLSLVSWFLATKDGRRERSPYSQERGPIAPAERQLHFAL